MTAHLLPEVLRSLHVLAHLKPTQLLPNGGWLVWLPGKFRQERTKQLLSQAGFEIVEETEEDDLFYVKLS